MTTTRIWPANRACASCTASFFPRSAPQLYCSPTCRERAKYERKRNDPEKWAAYLARLRDKYEPKGTPPGPTPTHVGCQVDDCDRPHLARGFCRRHYYRDRYRRGLDRRAEPEIIAALVKHYDDNGDFIEDAWPRRLVAKVSGSMLVPECPDCGQPMFKIPNREMDLRDCGKCRVRALLNPEEVSWLTSEAPSIGRSRQTVSSSAT